MEKIKLSTVIGEQVREHSQILQFPSPVQRIPSVTLFAQQDRKAVQ